MTTRLVMAFLPVLLYAQDANEFQAFLSKIHAALGLRPGSIVADVGAGNSTDLDVSISKVIGTSGRLTCEDIDEPATRRLERKLKDQFVDNVTFLAGEPSDPNLPPDSFDAVLIACAYHDMGQNAGAVLRHAREALKPDGRLVVIGHLSDRTSNWDPHP